MDLIVSIWKRKEDVHDPGKYRRIKLLSQILKPLERLLDAVIRRVIRPETDGRKETGGTGQYGYGVRRPGESF